MTPPEEAVSPDSEQLACMRPMRQTVRQPVETAPHDGEQVVRIPSVRQPVETTPHNSEHVETAPHDDKQKETVKKVPPGGDESCRSPSTRKVEVSEPVPDNVAINMFATHDGSVDITKRIGLSSTVDGVVDCVDFVLVALRPANGDGVDITVDAFPDTELEPASTEPLAKLLPQGPRLPPITDKSYIKYSHSAWESVIRHKYQYKNQDVIPADKHILRGAAEVSLRKEVARLLTLNTAPIPEEAMYKYVTKKEDYMPFFGEEKTSPTSHKEKSNSKRRQLNGGMFSGISKSDTVEEAPGPKKKTAKKEKDKKLPEPLIVDEKTNQLVPTDFMIDVSAVFPTIIKQYSKYAQKVLCRVGYTKITLVKRKPGKSSSDEPHNIVQLRLLSEFPFMYGRISLDRNLRLTWYQAPFKWLLYRMKLIHENKTKTIHALCIVPLRRICAFEYPKEEDDSHLYGDPPIRQNGVWKAHSVFTEIVHSENAQEVFEAEFWDVVLDFKWRSYAALRWLLIWLVEIIYIVLWFVSTNPMVQRHPSNSDPPEWPVWSVQFQIGAISLGSLFLCHEIRQLIYHGPKRYFHNVYNFIDLLCYVLPITISVNNLQARFVGTQIDLTALTILLLWLHFLQRLRVFKSIGIFVNTLLRGVKQIIPFLAVVFVILVGFGHGTWALLGNYDADPKNGANTFSSFSTSLKNTYWGITGDMSGLQAWDGFSPMADIFRFMFTFVAIVYLFNLLIAMLGDNYAEAFQNAGASFRLQRAKAIAEIECFWMFPWERRNKVNFPDDIFYEAKPDDIHEWEEDNKPVNVKFD
ncbi:Ion transport protein-domain-containing protein [Jimgerdemannia flammicorona]|uniref:Ion transport protein-domain-containing protein n=1 Tax=Jimgerdemannia flammicorona TaxID=994334 RepID=A0A433QKT0_9FUNG|nr:Ion transport protein-domain-containing protein [Jimgerdemannia flammicorona]